MKQPRRRLTSSTGFTLIELIVVTAVIAVLAAVAMVSMLRAKNAANEASAIASIRAINTAQGAYSTSAAAGGYATELAVLATPCPGGTAAFISPDLAVDPAQKSGYNVTLTAGTAEPGPADCNGTVTRTGYYLTASPLVNGSSGTRAFATSNPNVIYVSSTGVPPTEASMGPGGGAMVLQ